MSRAYSVSSLILIAAAAMPARAQGFESAFVVGYGILSIGAITSLLSRDMPPTVATGTRIRVRVRSAADWSNPLLVSRVTTDSMFVANDSIASGFARFDIDSLQVKAGTGRWAEGWLIGLVAGGGTGAILGYEAAASDGPNGWFTPAEGAIVGGVFLGVSASIVGAGIGLLAPSRWVTTGNPTSVRLSILPTFARPGLVARIRF